MQGCASPGVPHKLRSWRQLILRQSSSPRTDYQTLYCTKCSSDVCHLDSFLSTISAVSAKKGALHQSAPSRSDGALGTTSKSQLGRRFCLRIQTCETREVSGFRRLCIPAYDSYVQILWLGNPHVRPCIKRHSARAARPLSKTCLHMQLSLL